MLSQVSVVYEAVNSGNFGLDSFFIQPSLPQDSNSSGRVERVEDLTASIRQAKSTCEKEQERWVSSHFLIIINNKLSEHRKSLNCCFHHKKHLHSRIIWNRSWCGLSQSKTHHTHTVEINQCFHLFSLPSPPLTHIVFLSSLCKRFKHYSSTWMFLSICPSGKPFFSKVCSATIDFSLAMLQLVKVVNCLKEMQIHLHWFASTEPCQWI